MDALLFLLRPLLLRKSPVGFGRIRIASGRAKPMFRRQKKKLASPRHASVSKVAGLEQQVAQRNAVIANDNLPASLLQSVVQRRQADVPPTFIRRDLANVHGKESQQRKPQLVFPPKRPSVTQRKHPFQTKEHPRMKNKKKQGKNKGKSGPTVIAQNTHGQETVNNVDTMDTAIPPKYHKREAIVMIESKEEADLMEKTQDGVWLKRDFPSARPGSREEVLLLEKQWNKCLKV